MPGIPSHPGVQTSGINTCSLVRIAEVYSKQSKALFCSSNNPKGKILMKAAWFSDICLPWTDMREATSQLKKKHALLSISKKAKHLPSTLPQDFSRGETSLFSPVVSNKLYTELEEGGWQISEECTSSFQLKVGWFFCLGFSWGFDELLKISNLNTANKF